MKRVSVDAAYQMGDRSKLRSMIDLTKDSRSVQKEPDDDFWKQYCFAILAKLNDIEKSSSRIVGLMLLTAVTFELVNRRKLQEVNIGFAKLSDVSFLLIALPIVLAYLFATFSELTVDADLGAQAYEYAFTRIFPTDPKGWWRQAISPSGTMQAAATRQSFERTDKLDRLNYAGAVLKFLICFLGALAFEAYAFVQLYIHQPKVPVSISLILSLLLIASGITAFITGPKAPKGVQPKESQQ